MTPIAIAQSTPTAAAIAAVVSRHYELGVVLACEFLRRSFNQLYGLQFTNGRRVVARLSSERPRGEPNIAYEAALLQHLRQHGVPVSTCLPASDGADAVVIDLPEGSSSISMAKRRATPQKTSRRLAAGWPRYTGRPPATRGRRAATRSTSTISSTGRWNARSRHRQ